MDRAHKFVSDAREEALALMEKPLQSMSAKELDLLVVLCDAHNGVCELMELTEKLDESAPRGSGGSLFGDGHSRRRR